MSLWMTPLRQQKKQLCLLENKDPQSDHPGWGKIESCALFRHYAISSKLEFLLPCSGRWMPTRIWHISNVDARVFIESLGLAMLSLGTLALAMWLLRSAMQSLRNQGSECLSLGSLHGKHCIYRNVHERRMSVSTSTCSGERDSESRPVVNPHHTIGLILQGTEN